MARSSYSDEHLASQRDSAYLAAREPYGYPSSSARESRWDVAEYSLRPTARAQDAPSSSRARSRSRSRSARPPKSRDMHRKKRHSGGGASSSSSSTDPVAVVPNNANNAFSPAAMISNLQNAFHAFQSMPQLSSSSFELGPLPDTPVTNLINPKNLTPPASQAVLHDRLATNLPRHSNVYLILLVGTLLATHWLVLAALFGVVKVGFFIQSYNGRDLARDLGVRKYASSQSIVSGFAAASAIVGLWAFSSLFSVVFTLVKVAGLVLAHAACFEVSAAEHKVPGSAPATGAAATAAPAPSPVPAQGFLRPHGAWGQLSRDAANAVAQFRSVSEGQLRSASESNLSSPHPGADVNGWYAGEGYTGPPGPETYAEMPRTPRTYEAYAPAPSPRREEHDGGDLAYGYYESGRPQSYASGRSY
ncbi:uncharacterized protein ColSpa_04622 [Colletotrichum spaethianum]|uniref:Prenylated Rab acceptor 1 n=1 Tax=Colletotrichum spaethianum TaxID=700344 RepID=A0AA37L9A5_9PEZI|nr:uncharacterized protein ColSpa_04622 [Colletotrichum spaethianum]GKT44441.1 hypothetical protein ColSpa_04622 [Colletotrichum spaethianum]